jgi:hypothetical protein
LSSPAKKKEKKKEKEKGKQKKKKNLLQTQAFRLFHLEFEGDVKEYILNIIVIGFGRRIYEIDLSVIRFDGNQSHSFDGNHIDLITIFTYHISPINRNLMYCN